MEPHDAIGPNQGEPVEGKKRKKSWHLNKKIRKMAKLEVSDAFELRGRVIVGMLVVTILAFGGLWMGVRWLLQLLSHVMHR